MHHRRTLTSLALAGLVALGPAAPALAADQGDADSGNSGGAAESGTQPVSDQQLEQFAVALVNVRQVRLEYTPKLQQAEDKAEQQRLRQQGRQDMLEAIRETGLDVEEYNRLGNRIGSDAELKQRVRRIMQQHSG
ncbi:MAG: DUF4168 domain-containing protein [Halofilum sp. (in: g-proteobacteria)]|nr:DUF4168 domain-containing protein [Halofilum sp. (in: g-proteobacteria)]